MSARWLGVVVLLTSLPACAAAWDFSGQVRVLAESRSANTEGALTPANAMAGAGRSLLTEEATLRGHGAGLTGSATFTNTAWSKGEAQQKGVLNELYWEGTASDWHATLGKKVVSWDVGYAFRPLDVVQRENRRAVAPPPLEGVPVIMAERFGADTAWTLVIANPGRSNHEHGRDEPAIAARAYLRQGSVDWHAVARVGAHTGASGGLAVAWVVSDSLEVHASARALARTERVWGPQPEGLLRTSPYDWQRFGATAQALVGASWTGEDKVSAMLEAWYDGEAPSQNDWRTWRARNGALGALAANPWVPQIAQAGNLAWQTAGFGTQNLRRQNLMARVSRSGENWTPTADLLYTPEDGGWVATASLGWVGDRWQCEAGARVMGGAPGSVLRTLTDRATVWVSTTVSF